MQKEQGAVMSDQALLRAALLMAKDLAKLGIPFVPVHLNSMPAMKRKAIENLIMQYERDRKQESQS